MYKLTPQEAKYWKLWRIYCKKYGKKSGDSQTRHEFHSEALGYEKSHKDFSNFEYDIVYSALLCSINERKFDREEYLDAAQNGARTRKVFSISQLAPEAYIIHVAKQKFKLFNDWRNLPIKELEQLRLTILNRDRAHKKKIGIKTTLFDAIQPITTNESDPF